MSVHYEDLKYYKRVPENFFWRKYKKYITLHPDSFKMTLSKFAKEIYYIEEGLYESIKRED